MVFNDNDAVYNNVHIICEIFYNHVDFFITANMTD